jgi:hypothetical protein
MPLLPCDAAKGAIAGRNFENPVGRAEFLPTFRLRTPVSFYSCRKWPAVTKSILASGIALHSTFTDFKDMFFVKSVESLARLLFSKQGILVNAKLSK